MKRAFRTLAAAAALATGFAIGGAQAVTITYDFVVPGDGSTRGSAFDGQAGFTTNTFNGGVTPRNVEPGYTGAYTVFGSPSGTGESAAPANDTTNFFSVPNPSSTGVAELTLDSSANYFGLYWGSIDTYNTIAFLLGADVVASFTGGQLPPDTTANGNQTSETSNRYVNFFFGSDSYDMVTFTSTNFAFETDNHTFGRAVAVPEPATLLLLGAGLLGLGFSRRKSR